ncbi:MAG: hypothetical protein ACYDBB_27225 [Armatimonadota bacterium]
MRRLLGALLLLSLCAGSLPTMAAEEPQASPARYLGDQAWFMPNLGRYLEPSAKEVVYPQKAVTRKDYIDFLRPLATGFEDGPDHGIYGPRHALAALAVYAYDPDSEANRKLGDGIKRTLYFYSKWVDSEIKLFGSFCCFEGGYLCALYFRELRKRGQMTPEDEEWAKELLIKHAKYEFAWSPGDGLWRGQHHRSQAQGANNALAAAFYPKEPEAPQWKAYADAVWGDWWNYRDVGINDNGYMMGCLERIMVTSELLGRKEVFTDPQVQEFIWKRLLHEVSSDGVVIPYGAHGGYNTAAGGRIFMLELMARYSRDGRYKWVANRMMNWALANGGFSPNHQHLQAINQESIALASLVCDDAVTPVKPDSHSQLIMRKEVLRLDNDQVKKLYPDAGGLDCNMAMSQKVMPSKLAFRSGWNPGDFFMLVECFTRHDPLNPTAIIGLERFGASFAYMTSEKFVTRENAVHIDDLSGTATFCGRKDWKEAKALPTGYDGMEATVPDFSDHAMATYARVHVANYLGYNAAHDREFLFVKNRYVVVRDCTRFEDSFRAKVGPVWNTQNIGPTKGTNWMNTWFTGHWFQNRIIYTVPPWDLLIYHAPHVDRTLNVLGRWQGLAADVPYTTQYTWEGDVTPGTRVQFVEVLLPHAPTLDAAPLADTIQVFRDEPGIVVVRIQANSTSAEFIIFNEDGKPLNLDIITDKTKPSPVRAFTTDARMLYFAVDAAPAEPPADKGEIEALGVADDQLKQLLCIDGSYFTLNGEDVFRNAKRSTVERRGNNIWARRE